VLHRCRGGAKVLNSRCRCEEMLSSRGRGSAKVIVQVIVQVQSRCKVAE
jgi:hypothetical protein